MGFELELNVSRIHLGQSVGRSCGGNPGKKLVKMVYGVEFEDEWFK